MAASSGLLPPDIFHDLYGHLPFLVDLDYTKFCQHPGHVANKHSDSGIRMCERLFWFAVEFPLAETSAGRRIFGGGILSSFSEPNYSLSLEPDVVSFDLRDVIHRDYNINEIQKCIYLSSSPRQLYVCLSEL